MKKIGSAWLFVAAFYLVSGCVSSIVEETRQGATGVNEGDRIVVLGRRHKGNYETELSFVSCLGNRLRVNAITVLPESSFVDLFFPWFEPRIAPLNVADLRKLLARPSVIRKIREQKIRYLVWVDGNTVTSDANGTMSCSISPTGAGCLGFISWEQDANYDVSVWDVQSGERVGQLSGDASGTSYMPAVLVPLPLIARVQNGACRSLGGQIAKFLLSGDS